MIRLPFFYPFENRRWPFFYFQSSWLVNNMPPWLVADFQYNPEYRNKFQFHRNARQDFHTGPYFIMHTLLCFKKTIAITIDVLWDCGALFFLLEVFFLSLYGLKKSRSNFCLKYGKSNSFSCNFGTFPASLPIFQFSNKRKNWSFKQSL